MNTDSPVGEISGRRCCQSFRLHFDYSQKWNMAICEQLIGINLNVAWACGEIQVPSDQFGLQPQLASPQPTI